MPNKLKEIPFQASTIETIDTAMYEWLDKTLNLSVETHSGFTKVPVIWVSAERSYITKKYKERTDKEGTLKYPLISVERTSFVKDLSRKAALYGNVPGIGDKKGGSIVIARKINQDKTSNFVNAETKIKKGQLNFPRKSEKVVYNTYSIPIPVYIDVTYVVKLKSQYQQEMNEMLQPFVTKTDAINYFILKRDGHRYEGFIQQNYNNLNNVTELQKNERTFETEIEIKVLGYLIGGDKNEEKPKIVVRENAVDVKIPREHVIMEDDLPWKKGKYVGIDKIKY